MPRFSSRDQATIKSLTDFCVLYLEMGKDWEFTLGKPYRWFGEPWRLLVNNEGAGIVRSSYERKWAPWAHISRFGVETYLPGYLFMVVKIDGKESTVMFPGTSVNYQPILVVLQHIHERKAGRYIYPRLKPVGPPSSAHKVVTAIAGEWDPRQWDKTLIPEGTPPPLAALPAAEMYSSAKILETMKMLHPDAFKGER